MKIKSVKGTLCRLVMVIPLIDDYSEIKHSLRWSFISNVKLIKGSLSFEVSVGYCICVSNKSKI